MYRYIFTSTRSCRISIINSGSLDSEGQTSAMGSSGSSNSSSEAKPWQERFLRFLVLAPNLKELMTLEWLKCPNTILDIQNDRAYGQILLFTSSCKGYSRRVQEPPWKDLGAPRQFLWTLLRSQNPLVLGALELSGLFGCGTSSGLFMFWKTFSMIHPSWRDLASAVT